MNLKSTLHRTSVGRRLGDSSVALEAKRAVLLAIRPLIVVLQWAWYRTPRIEGTDGGSLTIGHRVSTMNTIFNLASGSVTVGDDTIFGYNCMVLTGRHEFVDGARASLSGHEEVPRSGGDITIGRGCWIASGATIAGGVTIGDHAIVAGGAVVIADIPDHGIAGGIPAQIIGDTRQPSS